MHRLQAARHAYAETRRNGAPHLATASEIETRFMTLSERERQVLQRVVSAQSNKQIARDLGIAEVTVKLHRGTMTRKMAATTLIDLVRMWDTMVRAVD